MLLSLTSDKSCTFNLWQERNSHSENDKENMWQTGKVSVKVLFHYADHMTDEDLIIRPVKESITWSKIW